MSHENAPNGPKDADGVDTEALAVPVHIDTDLAQKYRWEFLVMCLCVGFNQATMTVPGLYANSYLTEDAGDASNAVLYGTSLVMGLWFSSLISSVLGTKLGLCIGMGLCTLYVLLFAWACHDCNQSSHGGCTKAMPAQTPIALIGSAVGGCGAGILWTCQGIFFADSSQKIATAAELKKENVTAELSAWFAGTFLACECLVRAVTTLIISERFIGIDDPAHAFYVVSAAGLLPLLAFFNYYSKEMFIPLMEGGVREKISTKWLQAISLWSDPRMWLLQPLNLAMGFAIAWNASYVNPQIHAPALGTSYIGLISALLSAVAAIFSYIFHGFTTPIGKGIVMLAASATTAAFGIMTRWVVSPKPQTPKDWDTGVLVFPALAGIGRAAYESTNKSLFADYFPDNSAGAFSNAFAFNTGASTIAFVIRTIEDSEVMMDGSMLRDEPEAGLYLLLISASLIVPCYILVVHLSHT